MDKPTEKQVIFEVSMPGMVTSYNKGDKATFPAWLADAYCADGRAKYAEPDPEALKKQIADLQTLLKAVEPKPAK